MKEKRKPQKSSVQTIKRSTAVKRFALRLAGIIGTLFMKLGLASVIICRSAFDLMRMLASFLRGFFAGITDEMNSR